MSYSLQEFQSIKMYHRADQGPCPRGFHIGSKAEWQSLINALTTLWVYNVSTIPTVLNIPSAYYLARSNGSLETRYWIARYWTSTMESNTIAWAWGIDENNSLVFQQDKPGNAFSIRPFKDEPVVPDSSWTESPSWIFKNTTLWLISIQDGSNWITISDKNLWATNVWDDGLYYQFWNNYWFTVNPTPYYTSKVSNTQAYWPSNYYNDDHFVRVSSWNNWFTDTNNNIRWWVDTTSLYPTEAKEVWLGNHKVRPTGWTPWVNTKLYLPLNWDVKDPYNNVTYSWGAWSASYATWSTGVQAANFTWSNAIALWASTNLCNSYWNTICFRFTTNSSNNQRCEFNYNSNSYFFGLWVNWWKAQCFLNNTWSNSGWNTGSTTISSWTKHLLTMTRAFNGTVKLYLDNNLELSYSVGWFKGLSYQYWQWIGSGRTWNSEFWRWMIKDFIIEDKIWTATEISDYYNQTKWDYWL